MIKRGPLTTRERIERAHKTARRDFLLYVLLIVAFIAVVDYVLPR